MHRVVNGGSRDPHQEKHSFLRVMMGGVEHDVGR